jgi:hypothetical protein
MFSFYLIWSKRSTKLQGQKLVTTLVLLPTTDLVRSASGTIRVDVLHQHNFLLFWPTHRLCQHKYSTERQQNWLSLTHPPRPSSHFSDVIYVWFLSLLLVLKWVVVFLRCILASAKSTSGKGIWTNFLPSIPCRFRTIWQYGFSGFRVRDTKLDRF